MRYNCGNCGKFYEKVSVRAVRAVKNKNFFERPPKRHGATKKLETTDFADYTDFNIKN